MVSGELRKGYVFGRVLAENSSDHRKFLDPVLESLSEADTETINTSVVSSYLKVLFETDLDLFREYLAKIYQTDSLNRCYVACVSAGEIGGVELDNIVSLVLEGKLTTYAVKSLSYGGITKSINSDDVLKFCDRLAEIGGEWLWVVLDILSAHCHGEKSVWDYCLNGFEEVIRLIDFFRDQKIGVMDFHHWEVACKKLIERGGDDTIAMIVGKVFSSISRESFVSPSDHSIQQVLGELFEKGYFAHVLAEIVLVKRRGDALDEYMLEQLISTHSRRRGDEEDGYFSHIPEDALFEWCSAYPDVGPTYLAKLVPIYGFVEDEVVCHPLALRILSEYGDDPEVLQNLSSFAGVQTYWGTRIPELSKEKIAYEYLTTHANQLVRDWATEMLNYTNKAIAQEKKRKDEEGFGIY